MERVSDPGEQAAERVARALFGISCGSRKLGLRGQLSAVFEAVGVCVEVFDHERSVTTAAHQLLSIA